MDDGGGLPEMCNSEASAAVVSGRSCALVYNGSESQGLVHAVTLLSTLLNCVDELQDKRALLICKRACWEEAVASHGRGLTDCFEDCTFPCSRLSGPAMSGLDAEDALEILLRHAFRTESSDMDSSQSVRGSLSDVTDYDLCSQMSNATLRSASTIPRGGVDLPGREGHLQPFPASTNDSGDYSSMQKLIAMERAKEDKLKRLIVRFVDEMPLESLEDGVETRTSTAFNSFVEPGMEMKWNYIQAANEIALHPSDIAVVVISGMSYMQLHANPAEGRRSASNNGRRRPPSGMDLSEHLKNDKSPPHPFDSYLRHKWDEDEDEEDDKSLAYRLTYLRAYTFGVELALNALQANLNRSDAVNESLPRLFLLDSLPSRIPDQGKFIAFLRNRFQFLYKLA